MNNDTIQIMQADIGRYLQPISEDSPSGEDFSFSPEFDAIKKAREEDDPYLAQGEWATELRVADWHAVAAQTTSLLSTRTKDLRVAAWLAEALARTQGFEGVTQGCAILQGLCDQHWESVHPQPEDGDYELRIGALANFVQRSVQIVSTLPVTQGDGRAYSSRDYDAAQQFEHAASKDPDLRSGLPDYKVTLTKFSTSQQKTPRAFYEALYRNFNLAQLAWRSLAQSIDARLGVEGPSFTPVFDAFAQVERLINRLVKEAGISVGAASTAAAADAPSPAASGAEAQPGVALGGFTSRTQALQQLERVAEYFRHAEPHSPVAYLASKAAHWGNMPLHEWLRTVVKDGASLGHIEELLGLQTSDPGQPEPDA
ncbi:MAG: type VI secretion system protein TssA [Thiobacillus sp.]|nr:type VI secretion system protein TssA [Thiobacillus sp.]